jgi:hypothetical protein
MEKNRVLRWDPQAALPQSYKPSCLQHLFPQEINGAAKQGREKLINPITGGKDGWYTTQENIKGL